MDQSQTDEETLMIFLALGFSASLPLPLSPLASDSVASILETSSTLTSVAGVLVVESIVLSLPVVAEVDAVFASESVARPTFVSRVNCGFEDPLDSGDSSVVICSSWFG